MEAREVEQLIKEAAEELSDAMGSAAAKAVVANEKYGTSIKPFCRKVAERADMPEVADALAQRAYRLQKRRSEVVSSGTSSGPTIGQEGSIRSARSAIRHHPELAEQLASEPAIQQAVARQQVKSQQIHPKPEVEYSDVEHITNLDELLLTIPLRASAYRRLLEQVPSYLARRGYVRLHPDNPTQGELLIGTVKEETEAINMVTERVTNRDISEEVESFLASVGEQK